MEDDFPCLLEPSPDPVEGALPPLPGDSVPVVEEPSELPSSEPALDLPLPTGMEDEGGLPPCLKPMMVWVTYLPCSPLSKIVLSFQTQDISS